MTDTHGKDSVELSVVILCYRSGEGIKEFVLKAEEVARKLTMRYEIVLVGNYLEGSDDRTVEIVQELARGNPRYRSVCRQKKGMMGWDLRSGLEAAAGAYLCVVDGDGQFPIESIERCYTEIRSGNFDLVKTYRTQRKDGWYRAGLSKAYNLIFRLMFPGLGSRDINSKPKMLTRRAYERMDLRSNDWFIDAEIMLNVRRFKMSLFEFPIEFGRLSGRGSFVKCPAILEFIRNLVVYRIKEQKRLRDDDKK